MVAATNVREVVSRVLDPYVGSSVADTCVRATAISMGKTSDDLCAEDLPKLAESVRRLLGPVTTPSKVDALIAQITSEVS